MAKKNETVDATDEFELKFESNKPKTKDQLEEDLRRLKIDSFFEIWIQYIITHSLA